MKTTRLWALGIIAALFLLSPGCIPIVPGVQRVELAVTGLVSNQGVADAIVTIGAAQYGELFGVDSLSCVGLTTAECLDRYAELGTSSGASSSDGKYVASSDDDGHVALVVTTTTECEPATRCCPLDFCSNDPEDKVTGVDFYVRIETDDATEILTVEFTPGNTVSGEFFEVTVVSIGEPIAVDEDTPAAGGDEP